jgi:uncharacterized protein (TIGR02246 family)
MEGDMRLAGMRLADALARGDAVAAAGLYADDGRLVTPAAALIAGRRDIEGYWRAGIDLGLVGVELEAVDVQLAAPVAIELGRYTLAFDCGDRRRVADRGTYVVLHRIEADGVWRRVVDVFNPDAPDQAHPDRKEER